MGPPYLRRHLPAAARLRLLILRRHRRLLLRGAVLFCFLLTFLMPGQGRRRYQEVNGAPLKVGVGRQDKDPAGDALGAGFCEDVIRVVGQDLAGGDPTRELLHVPIRVYYSDQVQRPAWKNACQTTP
ncbi:UNVERIFIED_CONTAM: hypothetical protein Sradi_0192000 [Sesamum radiatum]|uniref:Hexosyltransferase n=1 Tax=Sesamum radiatum TaxID=300843 RepID=A0AAW2W0R5_SESRA